MFSVSPACSALGLRSGAIIFRNVHIGTNNPLLRTEIRSEAQTIRTNSDPEGIRTAPAVVAFQEILHKVGVNPRKEKPSLERLLGFAQRKGDLPAINDLVDAYNLVSVRTGCSLGAHALDRIRLPVALRFLTGAETFTALGDDTPRTVNPREFAYVDAEDRVLCRLDILQADFSKVTTETTNVLLIVEGTTWHTQEMLDAACTQVQDFVTRFCGGQAEVLARP